MAFLIQETGTKDISDQLSDEKARYHRQVMIEGWGYAAQERLSKSTVFVAGAGGLGSCVSLYLAAAGIGVLRICDNDVVETSNLNRQILHDDSKVAMPKVLSAQITLRKINPHVQVIPLLEMISEDNVDELVGDSDIIVDCMDNYPARYALASSAHNKNIPFVFGSVWGMEGQLTFIQPPITPCFKCIFPEGPPEDVFPIVGATPGVIGSLQVIETIKYLTGIGSNIKDKLLVWDGGVMDFKTFNLYRDKTCPICGKA